MAWASLVGDIVDVAVPFVTGLGETTRAAKTTVRLISDVDEVVDTARAFQNTVEITSDVKKSTGAYVVLYESGKNYVGKGGFNRAITSAVNHMRKFEDKVSAIIWAPTSSQKKAFISEYLLQTVWKVGKKHPYTYNLIWSPGKNK